MRYLDIEFPAAYLPPLDPSFIPFGAWLEAYLAGAERPVSIAVEREDGKVSVFRTRMRGTSFAAANARFLERLVKFLLWSVGGWRVYLQGCDRAEADALSRAYGSARRFDADFMQEVYGRPFTVVRCDPEGFPEAREAPGAVGGHLAGCRIGFDAGGSDRKVSAVIDGETVFSQEVVWHPKLAEDPAYHYDEILSAFRAAAAKMPRVDAIGVSSAGVIIGDEPMISSLFIRVPQERRREVRTIYRRAARALGDVPLSVANDGDVTALAGSMSLGRGAVMGIAMGTSQAAGYVDDRGRITGWLNELAFAPVDLNEEAAVDEWSGDRGVGSQYFSQDAVIRLAPGAGITLDERLTPAEKLARVQELAGRGHRGAEQIFRTIGVYLAHALALYSRFYQMEHLLILGRVASGVGGEWMLETCRAVLDREYPCLAKRLEILLPDEKTRRVGQSVAAASLPTVSLPADSMKNIGK